PDKSFARLLYSRQATSGVYAYEPEERINPNRDYRDTFPGPGLESTMTEAGSAACRAWQDGNRSFSRLFPSVSGPSRRQERSRM
ncbi:hypothetical protein X777_04598, partial [Ooceraea biroi]